MSCPKCPHCQNEHTVKNGTATLKDGTKQQRYLCRGCGKRFNERTNTPMAGLRTDAKVIAAALKARSEGLGVRATGRVFETSHATVIQWEKRVAVQVKHWSPPAPEQAEVTLEGDEVYTRVGENFPP